MARTRILLSILFLSTFSHAQSDGEMAGLVHDLVARLQSPPKVQQYTMPEFTVEITSKADINAFADIAAHKILINKALVQAFYTAPGELAFVIAHEAGHLQDAQCQARGTKLGLKGAALLRMCESAADQIGIQYLLASGYGAFDAAGAMGRLLMADPSQSSLVGIVLGRFSSDHPVDIDRVKQLAAYARQACEDRPEVCAQ